MIHRNWVRWRWRCLDNAPGISKQYLKLPGQDYLRWGVVGSPGKKIYRKSHEANGPGTLAKYW